MNFQVGSSVFFDISKNICTYIHMKNLLKKAQVIKLFFWFRPLRFICQLNGTVLWWQVPMQNMVNVVKTLLQQWIVASHLNIVTVAESLPCSNAGGFLCTSVPWTHYSWMKAWNNLVGCSNYFLNFKYKYRKSP